MYFVIFENFIHDEYESYFCIGKLEALSNRIIESPDQMVKDITPIINEINQKKSKNDDKLIICEGDLRRHTCYARAVLIRSQNTTTDVYPDYFRFLCYKITE